MKKVLFSAIALIAFSFTSVANNTNPVVLSYNIKVESINSNLEKESETPCADAWVQNLKSYQQMGYSFESASNHADWLFNACMESNYGISMQ